MRSIRRHLTGWVIGGVVTLSVLSGVFCFIRTRTLLAQEFDAGLLARGHALCALVQRDPNGTFEVMSDDVLLPRAQHLEQSAELFELWDSAGTPLRRSSSLKGQDLHPPASSNSVVFWNVLMPDGQPGRGVVFEYEPATEDETGEPPEVGATTHASHDRVTLTLVQDLRPVRRVEHVLLSSIALAAVLLAAAMLIVVPWTVSRALSPLRHVSEQAAAIDADRLSERFDSDRMPKELLPICSKLNDLLARLESSFQRERRFSADVAHELRTPIAELRALAEVNTRWPPDRESSTVAFQDAFSIAQQMEGVVTTLLTLARCEAGQLTVRCEPFDLCQTIRAADKVFRVAAGCREVSIEYEMPDTAVVLSDPAIVDAIIANVLSNAGTYCSEGGRVRCVVQHRNREVEVRVSNDSSELTAEDVKHVTEAYWRKDASRSGTSHAGLGLALVQEYSRAISADFHITLEQEIFSVRLRWAAAS